MGEADTYGSALNRLLSCYLSFSVTCMTDAVLFSSAMLHVAYQLRRYYAGEVVASDYEEHANKGLSVCLLNCPPPRLHWLLSVFLP